MTAKRRLSNFDFSKKGCHVSIVGSNVGGPANGITALILKSLSQKEEKPEMEMIEKAAHEEMVQKAVKEAVALVQKSLDEANEKLAAIEAEKVVAVEKARKDALSAVMGEANPELEATFAVAKSLDQAAFDLIVKSLEAANKAKESSDMFKEAGVSGEADLSAQSESKEMAILKAKYQK